MGGNDRPPPIAFHPHAQAPSFPRLFRHTCSHSVIPAQAGTRAQPPAPRQPPTPLLVSPLDGGRDESSQSLSLLKKIHPSPLLGGRLGGGGDVAIVLHRSLSTTTPKLHPSCAFSVIPAQAGMGAAASARMRRNMSTERSGVGGGRCRARGSCLRRNDERGGAGMARGRRRNDGEGGAGARCGVGDRRAVPAAVVPAYAGMTRGGRRNDGEGARGAGAAWAIGARRERGGYDCGRTLAASHPPPNLPPKRGEG